MRVVREQPRGVLESPEPPQEAPAAEPEKDVEGALGDSLRPSGIFTLPTLGGMCV